MPKARTLALSTLILVIGSIASKALGFLRESVLAYYYGATKITDSYIIALSIPVFILVGISGAVATSAIPIIGKVEAEEGKRGVDRLVSSLANAAIIVSSALMLIGIVFLKPLVKALAPGFGQDMLDLTVKLSLTMMPMAIMTMLQAVFNSLLQFKGDFSINALSGALQNTITIGFIIIASRQMGITAASIAALASSVAITLFQLYRLAGIGYKHTWIIDYKSYGFVAILKMMVPIMAAGAVSQLGVMIIRSMGTGLQEGSVAFINYAQKLVLMPYAIIGTSVITVFYPTISKQYHEKGTDGFLGSLHRSMSTLYFMLAPLAAGMMFLALPLVKAVYERGAFTGDMSLATSVVLVYLSVSMPFMGLADLFSKALFVMQDTMTPLVVTVIATVFGVALAWALGPSLSYIGLAAGMSGQYLASLAMSFALFNRKLRLDSRNADSKTSSEGRMVVSFTRKLLVSVVKTTVSTGAMMAALFLARRLIEGRLPQGGFIGTLIELALYVAIGGIAFIAAAAAVKADELMLILNTAKGFLAKIIRRLAR